ncbi:scm with four MBT domains protein 2-like, partial [Tropilaelaps mercedesae]
ALRHEEIDGPAFLLLTTAVCTGPPLRLEPREVTRLCEIVELAKFKYAKIHIQPYL